MTNIKINLINILFFIHVLTLNLHVRAELNYKYNENYKNDEKTYDEVYDPYQKLNRKIFAFNSVLDHLILRPIAVGYKNITNDYTKARVGNFIDNINEPLTIVNYTIQLNANGTLKSLWRFIINTTLGVGGLFDIASKVNLNSNPQTFGNSLAHYGVGPGPYLVIPFFGGTNARDVTDSLFSNNALNPLKYSMHRDFKVIFASTKLVHDRTKILPFTDHVAKTSTDPYITIRTSIHQNREYRIHEDEE